MRDDFNYWRRRAQEERERAMAAANAAARSTHLDLAAAYEALVRNETKAVA